MDMDIVLDMEKRTRRKRMEKAENMKAPFMTKGVSEAANGSGKFESARLVNRFRHFSVFEFNITTFTQRSEAR